MTEKGSTPVLKINEEDKILTDSADIIGYLDEKIAEPHLGSPSEVPERYLADQLRRNSQRPTDLQNMSVAS